MIELRKATATDVEFYYRVVAATIRPYVEQTWGRFDESANRKAAAERIEAGSLAREAKDAGKPPRLRVLNVNPARRLYEREGFRVTSTTPERTYMELPV